MPSCYLIKPKIVEKKWGREIWVHNDSDYCGKILEFNKGAKFSFHFHRIKKESFYVNEGKFILKYLITENASVESIHLSKGDIVEVPVCSPHQIECIEKGSIIEFSTQHFDEDSYRIAPGDSQV